MDDNLTTERESTARVLTALEAWATINSSPDYSRLAAERARADLESAWAAERDARWAAAVRKWSLA